LIEHLERPYETTPHIFESRLLGRPVDRDVSDRPVRISLDRGKRKATSASLLPVPATLPSFTGLHANRMDSGDLELTDTGIVLMRD
jgi:hypothetical protein